MKQSDDDPSLDDVVVPPPGPFDPPPPPPVSAAEVAAAMAAQVAAIAIHEATSGWTDVLTWRRRDPHPPLQIPPDLHETAPPRVAENGGVECSGCDAVVPFETMSINEHGYFCPGCARAMR